MREREGADSESRTVAAMGSHLCFRIFLADMQGDRGRIYGMEVPIDWPPDVSGEEMVSVIERAFAECGLSALLRGSLKSYPDSVHWHLRPDRERSGVLEVTVWGLGRRAWMSVHANRQAKWIDDMVARLQTVVKVEGARSRPPM